MTKLTLLLSAAIAVCSLLPRAAAFGVISTTTSAVRLRASFPSSSALSMSSASSSSSASATLTLDTTWRLRILLSGIETTNGNKVDDSRLFVLEGQFVEDEGFEPPQGKFRTNAAVEESVVAVDEEGDTNSSGDTNSQRKSALTISSSYYKLSEDPDDPKDGLWIWGLFKEPLYPYLLLQFETVALPLEGGDSIPPLKLYSRVNHVRDPKTGLVELKVAALNVRVLEQIQLPGAKVDLYEEERVGQISFQPL